MIDLPHALYHNGYVVIRRGLAGCGLKSTKGLVEVMAVNIFDYSNFGQFFRDYCRHRRQQNRKYSLRWISRNAKISSHTALSMIATGKRQATPKVLEKLAPVLNLTPEEHRYALMMISAERFASDEDNFFLKEMERIKKSKPGGML